MMLLTEDNILTIQNICEAASDTNFWKLVKEFKAAAPDYKCATTGDAKRDLTTDPINARLNPEQEEILGKIATAMNPLLRGFGAGLVKQKLAEYPDDALSEFGANFCRIIDGFYSANHAKLDQDEVIGFDIYAKSIIQHKLLDKKKHAVAYGKALRKRGKEQGVGAAVGDYDARFDKAARPDLGQEEREVVRIAVHRALREMEKKSPEGVRFIKALIGWRHVSAQLLATKVGKKGPDIDSELETAMEKALAANPEFDKLLPELDKKIMGKLSGALEPAQSTFAGSIKAGTKTRATKKGGSINRGGGLIHGAIPDALVKAGLESSHNREWGNQQRRKFASIMCGQLTNDPTTAHLFANYDSCDALVKGDGSANAKIQTRPLPKVNLASKGWPERQMGAPLTSKRHSGGRFATESVAVTNPSKTAQTLSESVGAMFDVHDLNEDAAAQLMIEFCAYCCA